MDSLMLFSRLSNRKVKVHPQKCTENYTESVDTNINISNTRPTCLKKQKSEYLSYEELVFPSFSSSLKQLHRDNTQENTNILSCDLLNNSIVSQSEENVNIQQKRKDVSERDDITSPKMAQKVQNRNWFEEIKKICFKLMKKIDVFKMMTSNRIVKDHWKDDDSTKCCSFCSRKFTMFFRRHHCRICGDIYCSSCSSGRTLLDPNLAMPAQFVAVTTSNQNIKYNRNLGGFEFDGFEYNYLDYEEVDQEQQEQQRQGDREHEQYWECQQQNQKHEIDYELGQDYDLYRHGYEHEQYRLEQEFDEEYDENYMGDEYSVTNFSDDSSDSNSFVDFNNDTACDLIYNDDDSLTVNDDNIDYGSEPVRERICINCHKVLELDENDWLL